MVNNYYNPYYDRFKPYTDNTEYWSDIRYNMDGDINVNNESLKNELYSLYRLLETERRDKQMIIESFNERIEDIIKLISAEFSNCIKCIINRIKEDPKSINETSLKIITDIYIDIFNKTISNTDSEIIKSHLKILKEYIEVLNNYNNSKKELNEALDTITKG